MQTAIFPHRITELVLENGERISGIMPMIQASENMTVHDQTGAYRAVLIMVQIRAEDYQKFWPKPEETIHK